MQDVLYEWDDDKAAANERNHDGVSFREAITVFEDPQRVEVFDERHFGKEGRYVVIGFFRARPVVVRGLYATTRAPSHHQRPPAGTGRGKNL